MEAWEAVVAKMASLTREQLGADLPLLLNDITPPRGVDWTNGLPASETLRRFYALCDGGHFGNCAYHLFGVGELAGKTARWVEMLRDYDARGDVLIAGRHLVFGEDAAGAPLVWDSATDRVAPSGSRVATGSRWRRPRPCSWVSFSAPILPRSRSGLRPWTKSAAPKLRTEAEGNEARPAPVSLLDHHSRAILHPARG